MPAGTPAGGRRMVASGGTVISAASPAGRKDEMRITSSRDVAL